MFLRTWNVTHLEFQRKLEVKIFKVKLQKTEGEHQASRIERDSLLEKFWISNMKLIESAQTRDVENWKILNFSHDELKGVLSKEAVFQILNTYI